MAQTMQKAQNSQSYTFFRVQLTLKKNVLIKRLNVLVNGNVFIMGYVTFSLGCYMVCCSVASLAVGYIFELFSFIFIRVLRPSLRPQNYV